jgi:two-component system chemotaxis response regulator CheB
MKIKHKIKVLVVDDSLLFRETLSQEIKNDLAIEVVGTASDPYVARDMILKLEPDVVTLDVEMPKMSGIEFLKKLIPQYPIPVIVVSSVAQNVFDALDAGAVEFVTKPNNTREGGMNSFINELLVKIKIASTAKVGSAKKSPILNTIISKKGININHTIIAIGASTGGTEAIDTVISGLPKDMPPILVVQHMPPVFTKMYAERLNRTSKLDVKEAEDGDEVIPGQVLIAPGDYQMRFVKKGSKLFVTCKKGEKVSGHCPSVDVLFDSVAEIAKEKAIGVLLTGMGKDGAKGLLKMKKNGAYTIGQDEKTSVVYGMPMVAFNIGAVDKQLPLNKIPGEIYNHLLGK